MHRTHVLNYYDIAAEKNDPFTPFLRVTTSSNGLPTMPSGSTSASPSRPLPPLPLCPSITGLLSHDLHDENVVRIPETDDRRPIHLRSPLRPRASMKKSPPSPDDTSPRHLRTRLGSAFDANALLCENAFMRTTRSSRHLPPVEEAALCRRSSAPRHRVWRKSPQQ